MADGLGRFGTVAGGIAEGLISGEELKLRERAEKRAEQAERRQGVTAGIAFIEKLPDLAKLDPSVRQPVFNAYLQGARQLGLDVAELERFAPEFAALPGSSKLYAKISAGKGTLDDKGQLRQLSPDLATAAEKNERDLTEITLGKTVEAGRAAGEAGGERAEIAAREAPGAGVPPARAREIFGPTGAEVGARQGAQTIAEVQAKWTADPERRAVELDLLRARAEAARRGPAASQAKAKLQSEALTAWHKMATGQPLTGSEERWVVFADDVDALQKFIVGGDFNALEALIAAMAEKQLGVSGERARRPIRPITKPGAAAQGDKLSRKDARYEQLRRRGLTDAQITQQFNVQIVE